GGGGGSGRGSEVTGGGAPRRRAPRAVQRRDIRSRARIRAAAYHALVGPTSPAALVLVAASVFAARALTYLSLRSVRSRPAAADEEAPRSLRAKVEAETQRLVARIAREQARALTDPQAVVVHDGVVVEPPPPLPLRPLPDSEGKDRVGDALLREAQRLEGR